MKWIPCFGECHCPRCNSVDVERKVGQMTILRCQDCSNVFDDPVVLAKIRERR